jgi:MoaA/NifB/PqqE/SkfB family radical SAM enzyme
VAFDEKGRHMGLKRLVVELTTLCNLDCVYCLKKLGTSHFDLDLLARILQEARTWGANKVTYTGGEASLYPRLDEALRLTEDLGYRYGIVTNGWHFARIVPSLNNTRQALSHIFFSLDSATQTLHDAVRSAGSFQKVMTAVELCRLHRFPFSFLVVVNRKNFHEMEELSMLATQVGANGILFGHVFPTSELLEQQLSLTNEERRAAEAEAKKLNSSLPIRVAFSASASNNTPGACCEPFAGRTASIDCYGRLSLCCQLADYRGAAKESDIVADLNKTDFSSAFMQFLARAAVQRNRRDQALASGVGQAEYPCHFCISSMGKTDWRTTDQR